jgi:hypothetical protein
MQIPHPLQCITSISGGIDLVTTASGQYSQQLKQLGFPDLTGMHLLRLIIGFFELQVPVLPASPITGFWTEPKIF